MRRPGCVSDESVGRDGNEGNAEVPEVAILKGNVVAGVNVETLNDEEEKLHTKEQSR
jgi:hypothetical protein